jgi:dTDP-4-amino-4,6-dideoxygalactose transaminase
MEAHSMSGASTLTAASPVPLLDVNRQNDALKGEIAAAIERVVQSGRFILGPDCQALEGEIASYCSTEYAVGCGSGSDALLLALMARGIGAGHDVIVPSYTFFATASAVWRLGARPVFADIDPATYNIDPKHARSLVTRRTRAIIPVHLFGQCADMDALSKLAADKKIDLIEDAAQAIGAEYHNRRAGSLGLMGCFSFYPTKTLGAFGEGGMLTTHSVEVAARLRLLTNHGMSPRYYHRIVGINSRLDTIQAAVLRAKLPHLEAWTAARTKNAQRYADLFAEAKLQNVLNLPVTAPGNRHIWNQFIVRVPEGRRDALRESLTAACIGTEIYYPVPLHRQDCFADLGHKPGSLPHTEQAAAETLALPIYAELQLDEQVRVVKAIAGFFAGKKNKSRNAA